MLCKTNILWMWVNKRPKLPPTLLITNDCIKLLPDFRKVLYASNILHRVLDCQWRVGYKQIHTESIDVAQENACSLNAVGASEWKPYAKF